MEKEGVTRYDPMGDAFDPNLHNALFEVPDATKEPGTVAVVIKVGLSGLPSVGPLCPAPAAPAAPGGLPCPGCQAVA